MDRYKNLNKIGDWSAGCQVVRNLADFNKILNKGETFAKSMEDGKEIKKWRFDYMLFRIEQMPDGFVKKIV